MLFHPAAGESLFLWLGKQKQPIFIPAFQVGLGPPRLSVHCTFSGQTVRAPYAAHTLQPVSERGQDIQILQQMQTYTPFVGELSLQMGQKQLGRTMPWILTNGCTVPVSEGGGQVSRLAGHSHQDTDLPFFPHSDSARLEENGSLGLSLPQLPPKSSDRSDPPSTAQFPGLWALSCLHLTVTLYLALGSGRKHKQGSWGLALSGTKMLVADTQQIYRGRGRQKRLADLTHPYSQGHTDHGSPRRLCSSACLPLAPATKKKLKSREGEGLG